MSWRLEPSPRTVGIEEGLAAKVHDPLWLLGRQWQLGEFNGKDAGTPALVQVAGTSAPVNAWRGAQQTDWTPFDGATVPLDALIEPEDEPSLSLRERIEAGAHFRRLLIAAGLGKYDDAFVSAHAFNSSRARRSRLRRRPYASRRRWPYRRRSSIADHRAGSRRAASLPL